MSMTPRMLQQRGGGARRPSAGPRWQEFEAFRRGMKQVDARTAIADDAANSVDPSDAVCTIWRGTTILILSSLGYVSWDGTTFTVISTTQTGAALVVGQGRAWAISERTITYTAPT